MVSEVAIVALVLLEVVALQVVAETGGLGGEDPAEVGAFVQQAVDLERLLEGDVEAADVERGAAETETELDVGGGEGDKVFEDAEGFEPTVALFRVAGDAEEPVLPAEGGQVEG